MVLHLVADKIRKWKVELGRKWIKFIDEKQNYTFWEIKGSE